jgi:5S rRNA maturation endonuclease (ribonuclease M5)
MSTNSPLKCGQIIRKIPLDQFRLPSDTRQWKQCARSRQNLLAYLATFANGDGSFIGERGVNYSPSEKTIIQRFDRATYYRRSEDLCDLGWLSWTRENHYGRRLFTIHIDNDLPPQKHVSNSTENTSHTQPDNTSHINKKTGLTLARTGLTVTRVTVKPIRLYPNTHSKNAKLGGTEPSTFDSAPQANSASDSPHSAINSPLSHDAAASIAPSTTPIASYSRATAPPNHPSSPAEGGLVSVNEDESETQFDIEPSPAELAWEQRRRDKQDRKSYAVDKSIEWREQPKVVRDRVMAVVKRYEHEWEHWATYSEDGSKLESRRESDNTDGIIGSFPVPSDAYKIRLALKLEKYTDEQAIQTWVKFLRRPQGFDGLIDATPWTLFLGNSDEFEVRVESRDSSKPVRQIRQQPPLAAFVAAFDAKRVSNGWLARCPIHADDNPSLIISQTEDGQVLVRCRSGCNQTDVWRAAVEKARALPVDGLPKFDDSQRAPKEFKATQADVDTFRAVKIPEVQKCLNEWGISAEVANKLYLGACPSWVFTRKDKSQFQSPAIITPHYDFSGDLVALRSRAVKEKGFTQWAGSSIDGLFAALLLDATADEVLVFEGDKDVALALSHGFNATGILSAQSKLSEIDFIILTRYKRIYLIGDQDTAGMEAMDNLAKLLPADRTIRVSLPTKDIGELYQQNPSEFKSRLTELLNVFQETTK